MCPYQLQSYVESGSEASCTASPLFVGFFRDNSTGELSSLKQLMPDADATLEKCEDICAGFEYMGLQYRRTCNCGNSFGSLGLAAVGERAQTRAITGDFAVDGLDFQGDFPFAISFGNGPLAPGVGDLWAVGDAQFGQNWGFAVSGMLRTQKETGTGPTLGTSSDAQNLGSVLSGSRSLSSWQPYRISLAVEPNTQYRLQLLFYELDRTTSRKFNVYVQGELVAEHFDATEFVPFAASISHTLVIGSESERTTVRVPQCYVSPDTTETEGDTIEAEGVSDGYFTFGMFSGMSERVYGSTFVGFAASHRECIEMVAMAEPAATGMEFQISGPKAGRCFGVFDGDTEARPSRSGDRFHSSFVHCRFAPYGEQDSPHREHFERLMERPLENKDAPTQLLYIDLEPSLEPGLGVDEEQIRTDCINPTDCVYFDEKVNRPFLNALTLEKLPSDATAADVCGQDSPDAAQCAMVNAVFAVGGRTCDEYTCPDGLSLIPDDRLRCPFKPGIGSDPQYTSRTWDMPATETDVQCSESVRARFPDANGAHFTPPGLCAAVFGMTNIREPQPWETQQTTACQFVTGAQSIYGLADDEAQMICCETPCTAQDGSSVVCTGGDRLIETGSFPPGTDGRSQCCVEVCPSGSYELDGVCKLCEPGFAAPTNSTSCTACPVGTFSGAGAARCIDCAAGSYAPMGATVCTECPSGSTALSSKCGTCPVGKSSQHPSAPCVSCAPGSYSDAANSSTCTLCPANTYAAEHGSTGCIPCGVGKTSSPGQGICVREGAAFAETACPIEWAACQAVVGCASAWRTFLAAPWATKITVRQTGDYRQSTAEHFALFQCVRSAAWDELAASSVAQSEMGRRHLGCLDSAADNYDPEAVMDDQSCQHSCEILSERVGEVSHAACIMAVGSVWQTPSGGTMASVDSALAEAERLSQAQRVIVQGQHPRWANCRYQYLRPGFSWDLAETECVAQGGHLASVHNTEQAVRLKELKTDSTLFGCMRERGGCNQNVIAVSTMAVTCCVPC
jgi:hypothetical protein